MDREVTRPLWNVCAGDQKAPAELLISCAVRRGQAVHRGQAVRRGLRLASGVSSVGASRASGECHASGVMAATPRPRPHVTGKANTIVQSDWLQYK